MNLAERTTSQEINMTTTTHPDALLISLGALMDQAISVSEQIMDLAEGLSFDDEDAMMQMAIKPVEAIIKNIEAIAAHTPDGEAMKVRAAAWLDNGKIAIDAL